MAVQQGWSQQTPAVRSLLANAMGSRRTSTGTKRKRTKRRAKTATAKKAKRTRRVRASGKRRSKLVKGSAAAKRFMANLRKKRRK